MTQISTFSSIDTAMVFAAGFGKRMRPLTDAKPKPLIEVGGRALIDYALDRLAEVGVHRAVINVHHLADQIENHLRDRVHPTIIVSDERMGLLETGGGLKKALPLLGEKPFLTLNSDSFWIEGPSANLSRLVRSWDPARMDILLLVAPCTASLGYDGRGDFTMDATGRLRRRQEKETVPFVYAGVSIIKPELLADAPEGAFSANWLYDKAIEADCLYGLRLDGEWLHVGDPQALAAAEARLAASARSR